MKTRSITPIVSLVIIYLLVVRAIFSWALLISRGDPFLLKPNFSLQVPETWLPKLVGVICVVGLLQRKWWGWWLTLAALIYELVTYAHVPLRGTDLSITSAGAWFKLFWLVAIGVCLWQLRRMARPQSNSR